MDRRKSTPLSGTATLRPRVVYRLYFKHITATVGAVLNHQRVRILDTEPFLSVNKAEQRKEELRISE